MGINNLPRLNDFVASTVGGVSSYSNMCDPLLRPNKNGRSLFNLIKNCSIFPLNGLKYDNRLTFNRNCTFRRGNSWISEIDYILCSKRLIKYFSDFDIDTDLSYPTNHAPVSICLNIPWYDRISARTILNHANLLNNYDYLKSRNKSNRKIIKYSNIDQNKFREFFNNQNTPSNDILPLEIDNVVENFSNMV